MSTLPTATKQTIELAESYRHFLTTYRQTQGPFAFAQGWHESRGYRSKLVTSSRNAWGIKWRSASPYDFHIYKTWEVLGGKNVTIPQKFVAYPSVESAVADYWSLVKRRYPAAFEAETIEQFAIGLTSGRYKWATDPNYRVRLIAMARKLN